MLGVQVQNFIFLSCRNFATHKRSHLVKLRKKTGLTYAACKKALDNCGNDILKAEQWLKDEAQALGWAKVAEVEGRKATKGLIGLALDKSHAALIEVNCESEFVTRNDKFRSLVDLVANSCVNYFKHKQSTPVPDQHFSKMNLESDVLKDLETADGKSLADHAALVTGLVGENLILKRATCFVVDKRLRLAGFIHPASNLGSSPLLGEYGSMLVFRSQKNSKNIPDITRQICQHIIGMNPLKIGSVTEDFAVENIENESTMIFQEFLFNPEVTIQQILDINSLDILDFVRYECGESYRDEKEHCLSEMSQS